MEGTNVRTRVFAACENTWLLSRFEEKRELGMNCALLVCVMNGRSRMLIYSDLE